MISYNSYTNTVIQLKGATMIEQEIRNVTKRFAEAYNRGDVSAAVEFYTTDAKFLNPNTEIISGKKAIIEFFEAGRALGLRRINFKSEEIGYDGNLAYERGVINMDIAPEGGQAMIDKGKYLVVMKRLVNGSWKVAVDIWNSDLPQPVPK
jgi:ketosteroid isomerase-like protein